jgi:4'-phosphopantetheinyl transferase
VWWVSTASAHKELLRYLDRQERGRWASFHRPADRARYLVAHAMVRIVVAQHLGTSPRSVRFGADACVRCREPHGKPRVLGRRRIEMSITHSGETAGIAVSWGVPIGIDVEETRRPDRGQLASAVLSRAERIAFAGLADADRHRFVLIHCTRKEALLKATGDGLNIAMSRITLADSGQSARLLAWEDHPELTGQIRIHDLHPIAEHVGSLAVIGADLTVTEFHGDHLLQRAAVESACTSDVA